MRSIARFTILLATMVVALSSTPVEAQRDVLVSRASNGAFWKWYGGLVVSPDFPGYQAGRFVGGSPGAATGTQMIPMDFNGDSYRDVLVFRSSDGAFWKWYGGPGMSPDFSIYQPVRYIGGLPGAVVGARMIPMNFNGDNYQDVLVFRSSDGAYWKWYGGPATSPDFPGYQAVRYIGGSPGAVTGAEIIPIQFNGDAYQDVLVFRSSDGAFWKWYGGPGMSPDFASYQPVGYAGGVAGSVTGARMIRMNFNNDAYQDVLLFRSSDGAFWKWYGGPGVVPYFQGYQAMRYIGGSAGVGAGAEMIPINFNGDVYQDLLVFRSADGAFWKWYGGAGVSPDFASYQPVRYINGTPGTVSGAQMIPMEFNCDGYQDVLVFRSASGAFWKWYGGQPVSPDFAIYQPVRYIGGTAGAVPGARMTGLNYAYYGAQCEPGGESPMWNT